MGPVWIAPACPLHPETDKLFAACMSAHRAALPLALPRSAGNAADLPAKRLEKPRDSAVRAPLPEFIRLRTPWAEPPLTEKPPRI
jgi:hypothetical protein